MTLFTWSQTASSNNTADSTINYREGQAPSTINNSARAIMAAVAKWRDDLSGNLVTGGSSTAYTLTSNQTFTSLSDGIFVAARMSATNGASPTLNVDSLGAKAIQSASGTAIASGELISGTVHTFAYDSAADAWIVHDYFTLTAAGLGLGTSDSPQFAGINLGHASDTTITRTGAGDIAIEGNAVYRAGGTDVPVADGGTGASDAATARTNLGIVAASDTEAGIQENAVQSEMETASSTTLNVTPGRQHFHPSAAKLWACVTESAGVYTVETSYNVTGITDNATGNITVTIATDLSSANYAALATAESKGTSSQQQTAASPQDLLAGSFRVMLSVIDDTPNTIDTDFYVAAFGDI